MKVMGQRTWKAGTPLEMIELPTREPAPNELRVVVKAIGVNPVDWKMRSQGPLRFAARLIGPPAPIVVGVDFAGVVDAVGAKVTQVKVGDAVVGGTDFSKGQRGSYADTVYVREGQVAVLPPGFDLDVAGALPVIGVTAWMSLIEIGKLQAGQKVLILGASGGVGQLCVQIARHVKDAFVVGVCSGKNVALVEGLGANVVVDYGASDPLAAAKAHAPFQVIVDCVGGYSGAVCRSLLQPGGRHVIVAGDTFASQLNFIVPPFTSRMVLGRSTTPRLAALVDAIAKGQVKVNIAERLPLADAEKAHQLSQGGRMTGKIVLHP